MNFLKKIIKEKTTNIVHKKEIANILDFLGGNYSQNKKYYAKLYNGELILINCENNIIVYRLNGFNNTMYPYPTPTDDGYVELSDKPNRTEQFSIYYLISPNGHILVKQTLNSNIFSSGISKDYKIVCLQSSQNKHFIIDVEKNKIMYEWHTDPNLHGGKYKIDTADEIIYIHNIDDNYYRYSFDGTFIDKKLFEKYLEKNMNGYQLYDKAIELIVKLDEKNVSSITDYEESIKLLEKAIGTDMSSNYKAMSCRKLGEIYLKFNMKKQALIFLKKALIYNDKIGVKRLVAKLDKELSYSKGDK